MWFAPPRPPLGQASIATSREHKTRATHLDGAGAVRDARRVFRGEKAPRLRPYLPPIRMKPAQ